MNKSLLVGVAIGAAVAAAGGAVAGLKLLDRTPDYAQVTHVEPVMKTVRTPRENCVDVPVTQKAPTRDPHRITGTAIGAVVGGVIGNQIGGGSGRRAATAAGVVAGGVIGNRAQERRRGTRTVEEVEQRCETVTDTVQEPDGFEVVYRYRGEEGSVRMAQQPGKRIAMRSRTEPVTEASPTVPAPPQ